MLRLVESILQLGKNRRLLPNIQMIFRRFLASTIPERGRNGETFPQLRVSTSHAKLNCLFIGCGQQISKIHRLSKKKAARKEQLSFSKHIH